MLKKYVFGIIIALVGMLFLSGCQYAEKQECIKSGGVWHPGITGVGGSSKGWCGTKPEGKICCGDISMPQWKFPDECTKVLKDSSCPGGG